MKFSAQSDKKTSIFIKESAYKNYKTYVAHYESRELQPMSFSEFLKNYSS